MLKKQLLVALLTCQSFKEIISSSWSYDSTDWSSIAAVCGSGTQQSPINVIRTAVTIDAIESTMATDYWGRAGLKIENNGHALTVKAPSTTNHSTNHVDVKSWGDATWLSLKYESLQFHFHQPSEHTFDGFRYDMELHQVHKAKTGSGYQVQAFFFMIGDESAFLKEVKYSDVGNEENDFKAIDGEVSPMDWITQVNDAAYGFYTYDGSFTTPPCTEGVKWFLWRKSMTMSKDQWDKFASSVVPTVTYISSVGNYRPTQTIGSRTVILRKWAIKNGNHRFTQVEVFGISIGSLAGLIVIAIILAFISKACYAKRDGPAYQQTPSADAKPLPNVEK